jgi:hypothetical protein
MNEILDVNKIFVVDDVAPSWLFDTWVERVREMQRWKYGMAATRQDRSRFFVTWVANAGSHRGTKGPFPGDHEGIADYFNELWQWDHLPKIMPDAKVLNVHRVHFNGQYPTNDKLAIHLDWEDLDMWTMIYYLDGEEGDTIFYDTPLLDKDTDELQAPQPVHKISFKPNRAVFFPSYYWHAAENPKNGFRISLAFNYQLNKCKVNEELRKDRGIVEPDIGHPDISDFLQELNEKGKYEAMHQKMQQQQSKLDDDVP